MSSTPGLWVFTRLNGLMGWPFFSQCNTGGGSPELLHTNLAVFPRDRDTVSGGWRITGGAGGNKHLHVRIKGVKMSFRNNLPNGWTSEHQGTVGLRDTSFQSYELVTIAGWTHECCCGNKFKLVPAVFQRAVEHVFYEIKRCNLTVQPGLWY